MYEVELKVPADHDRVRDRLAELGASHVGTVRQEDTYYDAPDRNFAETDEALRIRRESSPDADEESTEVTYKGPLVEAHSKTRSEAETAVEDGEEMAAILSGLGYDPAATVTKDRDRYRVDEVTVTLDAVDGLGEFVEVELESGADLEDDTDHLDDLRDQAIAVLDELGLDAGEQIRTSYLGLLLDVDEV